MQRSGERTVKPRHFSPLCVIGIYILIGLTMGVRVSAQQSMAPLTVDDIVKMTKVHLAEDVIISQLRKKAKPFTLSPDEMITLKSAGASDDVIRVMLDPKAATTSSDKSLPSDNRISDSEGQALMAAFVGRESTGRARLTSFTKTDGQNALVNGVPVYTLAFNGHVEFVEDCKWLRDPPSELKFTTKPTPKGAAANSQGWTGFLEASQNPGINVKRGQGFGFTAQVTFEKSERGWNVGRFFGKPTTELVRSGIGPSGAPSADTVQDNATRASGINGRASEGSSTETFPISSGIGRQIGVRLVNDTLAHMKVFLDGIEAPIEVDKKSFKIIQLEIGSIHMLKVTAPWLSQPFAQRFTVPSGLAFVTLTNGGVVIR